MGREQYEIFVNQTSLRWINHSMIILRKTIFKCLYEVKGKNRPQQSLKTK